MNKDQTFVIVLLIVLFLLEIVIQPNLKGWIVGAVNTVSSGLSSAGTTGAASNKSVDNTLNALMKTTPAPAVPRPLAGNK